MAGYSGFKMSNNAVAAYDEGERPLSKWTKSLLIERYQEICKEYEIRVFDLSKINAKVLKDRFLRQSSWHHTSSMYNRTNFYDISIGECEKLTEADVQLMHQIKTKKAVKIGNEPTVEVWEVSYLTWEGTRKHPKAVEHQEVVEHDTSKGYVETSNGRKMISAKGFRFIKKLEDK